MKRSEEIKAFLNFLQEVKSEYEYYKELLKQEDDLHNDIMHKFELDNLSYKERCKLATTLATSRKDRRFYKDHVEELEPIVNFMSESAHMKAINNLKQLLGEVRKVEKYHSNRTYRPRRMKEKDEPD